MGFIKSKINWYYFKIFVHNLINWLNLLTIESFINSITQIQAYNHSDRYKNWHEEKANLNFATYSS